MSSSASAAPGSTISKVELWYRPTPTGVYQRTLMASAGGGVYTVVLPIVASPGQHVDYYIGATSGNSYSSLSFWPRHTEWDPLPIDYTFSASGGMRITEYMYSGTTGEFVEFTDALGGFGGTFRVALEDRTVGEQCVEFALLGFHRFDTTGQCVQLALLLVAELAARLRGLRAYAA